MRWGGAATSTRFGRGSKIRVFGPGDSPSRPIRRRQRGRPSAATRRCCRRPCSRSWRLLSGSTGATIPRSTSFRRSFRCGFHNVLLNDLREPIQALAPERPPQRRTPHLGAFPRSARFFRRVRPAGGLSNSRSAVAIAHRPDSAPDCMGAIRSVATGYGGPGRNTFREINLAGYCWVLASIRAWTSRMSAGQRLLIQARLAQISRSSRMPAKTGIVLR